MVTACEISFYTLLVLFSVPCSPPSLSTLSVCVHHSQKQTLLSSDPVQHQHNTVRWLLAEGAGYNWLQNLMHRSLINNLSEMFCAAAAFLQWFWLLPQRTADGQWLGSKSTNGIRSSQLVSVRHGEQWEEHITHCWAPGLTLNEENSSQ